MDEKTKKYATLGGGCFWCLEAVYQQLMGVTHVESGYAGGDTPNPNYESVCSGQTGHAEVVRIEFNPVIISYKKLLEVFFAIHDPTTLNRQGNDVGSQYRSVIFYHDDLQKLTALEVFDEMERSQLFDVPLVTQISPVPTYYSAESYHQNYFLNHPGQGYCAFVVSPKVSKFREQFSDLLAN